MTPVIPSLAIGLMVAPSAKGKPPKNPRVEVYKATKDYRWRLFARNGEIVGSGEGYSSLKDARRGYTALERAVLAVLKTGSGKREIKGRE